MRIAASKYQLNRKYISALILLAGGVFLLYILLAQSNYKNKGFDKNLSNQDKFDSKLLEKYNLLFGEGYPIANQPEESPLDSKELLVELMKPTEIKRVSSGRYFLDSREPYQTGVLPSESDMVVTEKEIRIVGTVQNTQGGSYFTFISGVYVGDISICTQCERINKYYRYNIINGKPVNIVGPLETYSEAMKGFSLNRLADYSFLEEKDINNDGVNEVFLHQSNWAHEGGSGYKWKGFTVLEKQNNLLKPIVQVPIVENGLACGRCGDAMDGTFFQNDWKFVYEKDNFYPTILLTKKILYRVERLKKEKDIQEFTAKYDPKIHSYVLGK